VLEASHNPKMARASNGETRRIDLSAYEKLQTVSFALNKFEVVPRVPPSLKTLDLRSNKIASLEGMLPADATGSPSSPPSQLIDLILADNYLARLDPLVVENTKQLQRLDLTSNKLFALPYQLGFLTELSTLKITGNPVATKFASSVVTSSNPQALLKVLRNRAPVQTEDNQASFAGTKKSAGSASTTTAPEPAHRPLMTRALSTKGRGTLDLAGLVAEDGPVALEGLVRELKSSATVDNGITGQLLLDSNKLESLPDDLLSACLPNVRVVSLADNHLAELPSSLRASRSTTVAQLHLGKNRLTTAALHNAGWFQPARVSGSDLVGWSLNQLTHLDLSSNRLESFPIDTSPTLCSFPALEVLNLSGNKLRSVDDWKRLPASLLILDLSHNRIEDADPLAVALAADCPGFQRLSLWQNLLRKVPPSLGLLAGYAPGMASLNLGGNPQRSVRSTILEKPCGDLLEYLANRLTAEQRREATDAIEGRKKERAAAEEGQSNDPKPGPGNDGSGGGGGDPNNDKNKDKDGGDARDTKVLDELRQSVEELKVRLEDLSLTQAKKYAVKKALAMERSKLIREERRLGLRK